MLQKQARSINMEKLQIIVLFEANFNMNNKWMGRAILYTAKNLKALTTEQYGSRNNKAANVQSMNKRLFYASSGSKDNQLPHAAMTQKAAMTG